jgi:NAD(P)-dependent dehydrogenase (short-subunit alcohol dehydrogenase family)
MRDRKIQSVLKSLTEHSADVTKREAIEQTFDEIKRDFGHIDNW